MNGFCDILYPSVFTGFDMTVKILVDLGVGEQLTLMSNFKLNRNKRVPSLFFRGRGGAVGRVEAGLVFS